MTGSRLLALFPCVVLLASTAAYAQVFETTPVSPDCVADDENFTRFYDTSALFFAFVGFFLSPMLLPLFRRNTWRFADPYRRLNRLAFWTAGVFFFGIFLPPQLARVSPFFRPFGLTLLHFLGNIRLEYLDCDLHSVPKDYGFYFFLQWSPGPDLMVTYWWAQLIVFASYCAIFALTYVGVVHFLAPRRLEALAR